MALVVKQCKIQKGCLIFFKKIAFCEKDYSSGMQSGTHLEIVG